MASAIPAAGDILSWLTCLVGEHNNQILPAGLAEPVQA